MKIYSSLLSQDSVGKSIFRFLRENHADFEHISGKFERNFEEFSVTFGSEWKNFEKNLWRKKCVRRTIFHGLEGVLLGHCATCIGHLAPNLNITFSISI